MSNVNSHNTASIWFRDEETREHDGKRPTDDWQSFIGPQDLPTVRLCDFDFHAITEEKCIEQVLAGLDEGQGGWVVTANLDHLRRLLRDRDYAQLCRDATLVVADGKPLIWASKLQGRSLPERVAGSDLISSLSAAAGAKGRSVFLLGGEPGTADEAAAVLREQNPALRLLGTYCPPLGFEQNPEEMSRIRDMLIEHRPDIVYVALGSPKQEKLIHQFRAELPGTWWMGVGISFSFLCGKVQRAPRWMQKSGLEWLHRLLQEPRRLARRYLWDGLPFGLWLLAAATANRLDRRRSKTKPAREPRKPHTE